MATFVGYLMLKSSLLKNKSDIIELIADRISEFMPFLMVLVQNLI